MIAFASETLILLTHTRYLPTYRYLLVSYLGEQVVRVLVARSPIEFFLGGLDLFLRGLRGSKFCRAICSIYLQCFGCWEKKRDC